MGCVLSIIAHLYLALNYYPLKVGFAAAQSFCNINSKFDCDAVSASAYSAVFGVPLAIWGTVTNAVLFVLILLSWLEWTENPERLRRWTLALAGLSALASVVMASISVLFMSTYCIICIGLYVLSFIIFFAYAKVPREPFWSNIRQDFPHLWTENRGIALSILSVPLLAFLLHQIFMQNLGIAQLGRMIQESVQDWASAPKFDFVAKPALIKGPSQDAAALTLVEFADFRCGHCRRASHSLQAFVKAHPDVRLEFYNFPLDGACNDKIEGASGISCRLAATVYCAEQEGRGWDTHDAIFAIQDEINELSNLQEVDMLLSKTVATLGMNWESLRTCIDDGATIDAIKAQAKQGALVNVRGTPTLFANGRQIPRVLVPVLQEARRIAIESR